MSYILWSKKSIFTSIEEMAIAKVILRQHGLMPTREELTSDLKGYSVSIDENDDDAR